MPGGLRPDCFKKGDTMLVTNYRPIALLPTPSKILEKFLHEYRQLEEHVENEKLITYGCNNNMRTVALSINIKHASDCLI